MLTLTEIFIIIIIHWVADFIFQAEKWALGKSNNWSDLLNHTIIYSMIWYIPILVLFLFNTNYNNVVCIIYSGYFICFTLFFHTITDYFTSRIVSKRFTKGHYGSPIPNFGAFTVIGFDQVLHYVQLFTTYYLLKTL